MHDEVGGCLMITLQRRKKNHISGSCSVSQNSVCQSYVWVSRVGRNGDTVWPVNQHIKVTNWGGWGDGVVVCGGTQGKLFVSRVFVFGGGGGNLTRCGTQGMLLHVSHVCVVWWWWVISRELWQAR